MPPSRFGRFLLELSEVHNLLIMNDIAKFPRSRHHTYFLHARGSSVVDYVLSNPSLIPHMQESLSIEKLRGIERIAQTSHFYWSPLG